MTFRSRSFNNFLIVKQLVAQKLSLTSTNQIIQMVQVTKHEDAPESEWKGWNWRTEGDLMLNGAFFTPSGAGAGASYARASSLGAKSSTLVSSITSGSGVLNCRKGSRC